ncbi:MAG: transposase [Candidatus Omnitrophica bacterium]|nr:transposase [Candidatus Omnitrophota bacterium]
MRKCRFAPGGIYHIYNRGVDKREVFISESDYIRFLCSLYRFNDIAPTSNLHRIAYDVRGLTSNISDKPDKRKRLVNILYYALRPNHFHMTLQELIEKGIEKFMQKIGTGYTMYFNKKNKRSGALFQGTFKAIAIESERYLMEISRYIHLNPLKNIEPEFREKGVENIDKAKDFLLHYKWSSFLDYVSIKNFPLLINNEIHKGYFKDASQHKDFVFEGLFEVKPRTCKGIL